MIGRTLLHYRILSRLGAGGMGEVFRAADDRLGRDIALKVLPAEVGSDPERLKRFRTEARALAALDHPNIVTVYSVEEAEGVHFLTMSLAEGESLDSRIGGGLSLGAFVDIAEALARGLAAAHDKGIVHRDLKPANVMITNSGEVKILDFGLARLEAADASVAPDETLLALTREGVTMGTVPYMSPEQAEGKRVDHRSDLFSLGVMFYEMLSSARPFQGGTPAALVSSILRDVPRPVTELRSDLPAAAGRIVSRCLEKDPARRYASARELYDDLASLRRDLSSGPAPAAAAVSDIPSVAVLPFTDMSAARDHAWFCEGMAEELINGLSGIAGLRVAARASAFQLKGQDVRRIGELLKVKTVLDGSLRTAGKHLRVTAQLNDAGDGYQIWSKRYDRDMDDVFAVQDDIAVDIVAALEVELGGSGARRQRQTQDVEAYHLYLKGRHHFFLRTPGEMARSEGFFRQALERDPDYALALTGLADLYSISAFYGLMPAPEAAVRARELGRRAMAVDPDLSEASATNSFVEGFCYSSWDDAVRLARRAIALNSANVVGLLWGASVLSIAGIFDESTEWIERALLLDPLSPYAAALSALSYLMQFRDEAALRSAEAALALNPDYPVALYLTAGADVRCGRAEEAVRSMERAIEVVGRQPFYLGWLGWAYAAAGRVEEARAVQDELERRAGTEYVPWVLRGWLHGALAEGDDAFVCLERAAAETEPLLGMVHLPPFDPVRDDPRFASFLVRLGHPRGPR